MKLLFTTTPVCTEKRHCTTCRDKEGGHAWREKLRAVFEIPETDFECPHGMRWNSKAPPREVKPLDPLDSNDPRNFPAEGCPSCGKKTTKQD